MTLVAKTVYIDKLDDIVNKYNIAYHSTIKTKPVHVKSNTLLTLVKTLIIKIIDLELGMFLEYQKYSRLVTLILVTLQNSLKRFL